MTPISAHSSIWTTLSLPYRWQDSRKWQNNNILWISTKLRVEWTPFRAQMCTFEKSTLTSPTSGVAQTFRDNSTPTCHTPLWSPWNVQQNAGNSFLIPDQKNRFLGEKLKNDQKRVKNTYFVSISGTFWGRNWEWMSFSESACSTCVVGAGIPWINTEIKEKK